MTDVPPSDGQHGAIDHQAVIAQVDEDSRWSTHYVVMIFASAGIAILGLLLSSPAVVIGAMLISPLMGPIIGAGFGFAMFDWSRIQRALISLVLGVILAIAFSALISAASPLQTVTPEVASRTRPNLLDLGVAIIAGAAGTYASVRGRHGAIVGVAIAVAVMPPLAAIGFGIANLNQSIVKGASLLFLTNLTAIAAAAAILARIYGFGHTLSRRQSWFQAALIVGGLAVTAVPLTVALRQIAWEAVATKTVRATIENQFGSDARVSDLSINFREDPVQVSAVVFTKRYVTGAQAKLAATLKSDLERPVVLNVEQVRLGTQQAELSEIASASGTAPVNRESSDVARSLAFAAGGDPADVLVDPVQHIARLKAKPLPGATLATYKALEDRLSSAFPDWTPILVPPLLDLPDVAAGSNQTADDSSSLDTAAWASKRLGLSIIVQGREAQTIADALKQRGASIQLVSGRGAVRLHWSTAAAQDSGA